ALGLRSFAAAASSARNRSAVVPSISISSARASTPSASPRSRHSGSGSRYAPRPGALPRRSTESSPAGERTTRTSSRLARVVRQATQVRCGGWGAPPPIPRRPPFAWGPGGEAPRPLTALGSLLLAPEERTVLFIQVLLIRLGGFGFDLCHEIVADLRFLFSGHRLGDGDRLRLGLRLDLGTNLGLAPDVDPPACQLRGEAGVLALLADRERELPVRHDHVRRLFLRHDVDADDVGRFEGVRDVALGALRPLDDVDLLAAELVHDRLHAQSALPDAGASSIEARLPGADRDLRARTGLTCDTHDLHLA